MPATDDVIRSLDSLATRVHAEYREMPGLCLTAPQAARMWGIQASLCEQVLQRLVSAGALYLTPSGAYVASPPTRDQV